MELSISTSDSNKSEELQKYFYEEIKTKLSNIEDYKKKSWIFFTGAFLFLVLLVAILNLPHFTYQSMFANVLFLIVFLSFFIGAIFSQKVESGRSAPSENGYIFYYLKNIKKYLSIHDSKKAENELRSLIFYVNNIKKSYPDEPFTDRIFKNLSKFEEKLRTCLYPSLRHSNDEIAKNTEVFLNNALKLVMEGYLDAICDIDTASLDSEKISLDDLYEPTRFKLICKGIKDLIFNSKAGYLVQFLIIFSIIVVIDFIIKKNWELVKDDFTDVLLIAVTFMLGYVAYLAFLRDERRT